MIDLVLQGLNVLVESSRLVLIEYLLHVLKMDALVALYYIVPVCPSSIQNRFCSENMKIGHYTSHSYNTSNC
jgi:hypothetical protein